ncbi:serine/threonine-protein kinase pim-1-like [Sinocyclocheilus anshuiensis]|uniref:serine/threonine-protein kinase pim-1-like n=1 Tax=Sinocyclocheilus anshuiensis TaxID=1608454 RepID=UPI0007B7934C|nr:PREDICTED: serine/threonine-protein kinase pim-1-like [Sinocyclocheilus anshuiensis]
MPRDWNDLLDLIGYESVESGASLKFPPIPEENPPHRLDETPAGADVIEEGRKEAGKQEKKKKRFWRCRLLHLFSQRGTYNVAKAEKVNQSEAGSFLTLTDDQISLQHIPIVEIHDHQEAPASEVLPAVEEQLEQDVLQHQDVHTPVSSSEVGKVEELDRDQTSLQFIPVVEIYGLHEAVEEQLEQDVLQHQDVHTPVSSSEVDKVEELDKDQTSLQQIVEIHDLGEAPVSEVLPAPEEQLEQDVLQPQDVKTPVSSTEDEAEEPDHSHIFWRYEFGHKLGEGGYGCVHAGTRCEDGLKVAVKIADKTPNTPYIRVPGHPRRLPLEIGLTLMANKGPSVPQIIKLLDWQDDPYHYVMVLEQPMPCMSVFNLVKLRQRLDEKMARHVMWQVIHTANTCCERGVFHQVKLENLLVNPDTWEVKLIDFGCGTLMKDSTYMAFNGTDMFCPPKFDFDGKYHAKPATVWSLGMLLFVMVCRYYPDEKDLHRISKNDWSDPDLSQECCQMIHACLQPDPQRRLILEEMQLHDWLMVVE